MLEEHIQTTIGLIQANPAIGAGIIIVIIALFIRRTKEMAKLSAFILVMVGVFYLMSLLLDATSSGGKQKDRTIYKTREAIGD